MVTFGPFCTKFVYPGCWHFYNGATIKIDDFPIEQDELHHVLLLAVYL